MAIASTSLVLTSTDTALPDSALLKAGVVARVDQRPAGVRRLLQRQVVRCLAIMMSANYPAKCGLDARYARPAELVPTAIKLSTPSVSWATALVKP